MKFTRLLLFLPLLLVLSVKCTKDGDEALIQDLLESSWYIGSGTLPKL